MAQSKALYALEGNVAVITLNDPAVLNAMGLQMCEELSSALERAGEEARAVLLTGAGRAFCAGANMSEGSIAGVDGDVGQPLETHVNPLMMQIRDLPIPLVTAVRGPAVGVGCSLALAGDIIVASQTATFIQAFVNIGLVPDGGATWLLSRAIGRVRTLEMVLLGEKVTATRAFELNLVTRLVADEMLEATARELAAKLANGPTKSIAMIRKNVWLAADGSFEQVLEAERQSQRQAGYTADHAEGVAAFLTKRAAQFQGR